MTKFFNKSKTKNTAIYCGTTTHIVVLLVN